MLLVSTLAYRYNNITCAEGLYNLEEKYCLTVKECNTYRDGYGHYYHAYKELKMCTWSDQSYYQSSTNYLVQYDDGSYGCDDS